MFVPSYIIKILTLLGTYNPIYIIIYLILLTAQNSIHKFQIFSIVFFLTKFCDCVKKCISTKFDW